jgi:predicted metalloprotease with PDZ domain
MGLSIQTFRYIRAPLRRVMFAALLLLGVCAARAHGQQIKITIQVIPDSPRVVIEGERAPEKIWSFRDTYAGVVGLGNRIEQMKLFDASGKEIESRKLAPGQFEAIQPASKFRYEVNLTPPDQALDGARVSWLTPERGLLMLADLLPAELGVKDAGSTVLVRLKTPESFGVYSNEEGNPQGDFTVYDADRAVFVIGAHLRNTHTRVASMLFSLVTDGVWAFSDQDAMDMASQVLKSHLDVFKAMPGRRATLILLPFFQPAAATKWSAETRGGTVTLLLGKLPSKNNALAMLSVPLTHELFHLWVPNALALTGDYEWFYEGFTIYQAARAAVRLGLLTFPEFLNAIARAYDSYLSVPGRDHASLIEASQSRWTGGEAVVYQKAMLIAFLYDLKVRSQSRGKRSLDDIYRELFRRRAAASHPVESESSNEVIISLLNSAPGMNVFAESYVRRAVAIDLPVELAPFGLRVDRFGARSRVSVNEALTRQQRDLLRELGYNDLRR